MNSLSRVSKYSTGVRVSHPTVWFLTLCCGMLLMSHSSRLHWSAHFTLFPSLHPFPCWTLKPYHLKPKHTKPQTKSQVFWSFSSFCFFWFTWQTALPSVQWLHSTFRHYANYSFSLGVLSWRCVFAESCVMLFANCLFEACLKCVNKLNCGDDVHLLRLFSCCHIWQVISDMTGQFKRSVNLFV